MATRITFSQDVTWTRTAENDDGTIRWHVYSRTPPGTLKPGIYVQRQVNEVLEAEVLLMQEGDRPAIHFNSQRQQFDLLYRLNESVYLVRIDETTVPTTQGPQSETIQTDFSQQPGGEEWPKNPRPIRDLQLDFSLHTRSAPNVQVRSKPVSVSVHGSSTAGKLFVRWSPDASTPPEQIAGFNVYLVEGQWGRLIKLNGSLVPPVPAPAVRLLELEVPARSGTYFVTQVDFRGLGAGLLQHEQLFGAVSSVQDEGLRTSRERIFGSGRDFGFAASAFDLLAPGGESFDTEEITFVDKAPVFLGIHTSPFDKLAPGGESFDTEEATFVDKAPVFLGSHQSNLDKLTPGGTGFRQSFTISGFGTIIVT
jgi:hypothetical protein